MSVAKKYACKIFNLLGYSVSRINGSAPKDCDEIAKYKRFYPEHSILNRSFYNIGAGTFRHVCWKNIDLSSDWYAESQVGSNMINYDLFSMDKLPIEDDSAELVYTSHTVEHIDDDSARNMFNEAYRILKPGGVFRLTTPDIDLYYLAMINNIEDFYWWKDLYSSEEVIAKIDINRFNDYSIAQWFLFTLATHTSMISKHDMTRKFSDDEIYGILAENDFEAALNIFTSECSIAAQRKYFGYHMNWWNFEKARRMLSRAGFDTVYKSGYAQSLAMVMRDTSFFDKQDFNDSLYVEAIKR